MHIKTLRCGWKAWSLRSMIRTSVKAASCIVMETSLKGDSVTMSSENDVAYALYLRPKEQVKRFLSLDLGVHLQNSAHVTNA